MSNPMAEIDTHLQRPMRADARRNYEKLVVAARDVFTELGGSAPLEDVAERADVGIGTLYRHFPTRQALLEAVYAGEVNALAQAADELATVDPWDALTRWLRQYSGFAATKRALMDALLEAAPDSDVLLTCRTTILDAGSLLVERAQEADVLRRDTSLTDIIRMVGGVSVVPTTDPEQKERMLQVVLDGLRYRA